MNIVALEVALDADLYYEALLYRSAVSLGEPNKYPKPHAVRSRFSTTIRPDFMYDRKNDSNAYRRKVQILYGASQIDF